MDDGNDILGNTCVCLMKAAITLTGVYQSLSLSGFLQLIRFCSGRCHFSFGQCLNQAALLRWCRLHPDSSRL
jgi:hypothetical protein